VRLSDVGFELRGPEARSMECGGCISHRFSGVGGVSILDGGEAGNLEPTDGLEGRDFRW